MIKENRKQKISDFKHDYSLILEIEKQVTKHLTNLRKSAKQLYEKGEKDGLGSVKSLGKIFSHLDSLCYSRDMF